MEKNINNTNDLIDFILNGLKFKSDFVIVDSTAGNGKDSLKLLKKMERKSKLYCFDIQKEAVLKTEGLLQKENQDEKEIVFINDSHEFLDKYVKEKIDFLIMNLGYLPGGDKSITTKANSTKKCLEIAISKLNPGGLVFITFYRGFKNGKEEYDKLSKFLREINQRKFNVTETNFINQVNSPPNLVIIERKIQ